MRRTSLIVIFLAVGVVASCGEDLTPDGTTVGVGSGGGDQEYQGVGTVLESPEHGPQLCLGGVADSYPPQCGGPDLVGWDWESVDGAESANGSTWGVYAVTGTWDGERLTVTRVDAPEDAIRPAYEEPDFTTPCAPPEGGWAVVDAPTATDEAMQHALEAAAAKPAYVGAWLDQSINPAYSDSGSAEYENLLNDPTKLVLNVMFTGDLERHEAELRAIWGGALCVSSAPRSQADLLAIQAEVTGLPGVLGSAPDERSGTVQVSVIIDDGLQAELDAQYGEGVVEVISALRPVD